MFCGTEVLRLKLLIEFLSMQKQDGVKLVECEVEEYH